MRYLTFFVASDINVSCQRVYFKSGQFGSVFLRQKFLRQKVDPDLVNGDGGERLAITRSPHRGEGQGARNRQESGASGDVRYDRAALRASRLRGFGCAVG